MARNTAAQGSALEHAVEHHLSGCQNRPEPCRTRGHESWTGWGYDTIRSAASKGAVDIVAVGPLQTYGLGEAPDGVQLYIQCKLRNPMITPAERRALLDLALRAGAVPLVAYRPPGKRAGTLSTTPAYRQLTGPGPKDWLPWEPGEDD